MIVDVDRHGTFALEPELLERYRHRPAPWGYGSLSRVVFERTYSRDGEAWWQTCRRVVEGMFTVLRAHCHEVGIHWDEAHAHALARTAYERLWGFRWTPPGRGLWIMGTGFLYERGGAALNNCGFVSTRLIGDDYADPFVWMLRMTMLGVGVGFDTRGKGQVEVRAPARGRDVHAIEDSREGWAAALRRLLDAYVGRGTLPAAWDFSRIRPRGAKLESFGGLASGPAPLREMLEALEALHEEYVGRRADACLLVDAMNLVGRCVVAGGVRRSAQIAFGDPDDRQFVALKQDPEKVRAYRWVSNNSIFARRGMDYRAVAERTVDNGEPGYFWLDAAKRFGRLVDPENGADEGAEGSNPCVEQTLWHKELCTLVETYPANHDSLEDYLETLRVAYLYAKAVTLVPTGDPSTDAVMQRNRRVGCSMTGIVQAINRHGYRRFFDWCDRAYHAIQRLDRRYAAWLRVPRSIKTTSVKPSGTVSILAGATPGVHWEHAPHYLRRIRVAQDHPLVEICAAAGYPVEPDVYSRQTQVITFPVRVANVGRGKADVSLWEKVDLAAQMQRYWADNQVSLTAELDPEREAAELPRVLEAYEDRLKAAAFLPSAGHGYEQPPYETITAAQYEALVSKLRPLEGGIPHEHELEARYCEGGACDLEW
jgi:adenosylcobalamin-dependent ribonucleoside-triphosphate reductase